MPSIYQRIFRQAPQRKDAETGTLDIYQPCRGTHPRNFSSVPYGVTSTYLPVHNRTSPRIIVSPFIRTSLLRSIVSWAKHYVRQRPLRTVLLVVLMLAPSLLLLCHLVEYYLTPARMFRRDV